MTSGLLVIQHEDSCPPEWFGTWWSDAGIDLDIVTGHTGMPIPSDLGDHAGLVVLGGQMGADDDAAYGWLSPTKELIRTVITAGQPFLGICLGHQLAAVAMGGTVRPNDRGRATGLTPVALTSAGQADRLLGPLAPDPVAVQWNNDVVTQLPDGAAELATAPDGTVQAARFAERAWGVQFHPECSPALFRRWTVDKPSATTSRADGLDVTAVSRSIHDAEKSLRTTWQPVAQGFAEVVSA